MAARKRVTTFSYPYVCEIHVERVLLLNYCTAQAGPAQYIEGFYDSVCLKHSFF